MLFIKNKLFLLLSLCIVIVSVDGLLLCFYITICMIN